MKIEGNIVTGESKYAINMERVREQSRAYYVAHDPAFVPPTHCCACGSEFTESNPPKGGHFDQWYCGAHPWPLGAG